MGKKAKKEDKLYCSHPVNPWGDEAEEEFNDDLTRPRKEHYHSNWKPHQDAVYWIHLANAQERRLRFWQTRSHAVIVYDSVRADCVEKVV